MYWVTICVCVSMSVCVCTLTCMYTHTQNLYTVTESLFTEFLLLSWASFMFATALSLPPSVGKLIWKTINVEVSKVHWSLHSADPHLPWGLCTGGSFCVGCSPCDSPVSPSLASKVLLQYHLFTVVFPEDSLWNYRPFPSPIMLPASILLLLFFSERHAT